MAREVFLHIGAPKSGTTYLQTVLWRNRHQLREAGVLVPGRNRGDYNKAAAAMRLEKPRNSGPTPAWRSMLDEVHAFDGDVVLSGEWFCLAPAHLVGRTIEQLAPARVSVVYSARSFVHQVPAAWQESLKIGRTHALDDFVDGLGDDESRWSWWSLDPAAVLERWLPHVPGDRTSVVTVPTGRTDPDALLTRFGAAFGVDLIGLDRSRAVRNESLGVEAAELLRMVTPLVRQLIPFDDLHWTEQYRWLRRYLAHELLVPAEGHRIALRDRHVDELLARSEQVAAWVREQDLTVHGDLADITTGSNPSGSLHPDAVDPQALLAIAVPAMARLVADVRGATLAAEEGQ